MMPKPNAHIDILQTKLLSAMDAMRDNLQNLENLLVEVDPSIKRNAEEATKKLLEKMKEAE